MIHMCCPKCGRHGPADHEEHCRRCDKRGPPQSNVGWLAVVVILALVSIFAVSLPVVTIKVLSSQQHSTETNHESQTPH